jgi:hypothetical protein
VVRLPFDSPDAGEFLKALDADPQRIEQIRRNNVHQTALRHDWVHRLHAVFEALGLRPTEAMLVREERLRSLAAAALGARGDGDAARARTQPSPMRP